MRVTAKNTGELRNLKYVVDRVIKYVLIIRLKYVVDFIIKYTNVRLNHSVDKSQVHSVQC